MPDDDGKPQPMRLGLKEILQHFLDFRFETVKRRFEYELEQLRQDGDAELEEPGRWGTTFMLVQCWGQRAV